MFESQPATPQERKPESIPSPDDMQDLTPEEDYAKLTLQPFLLASLKNDLLEKGVPEDEALVQMMGWLADDKDNPHTLAKDLHDFFRTQTDTSRGVVGGRQILQEFAALPLGDINSRKATEEQKAQIAPFVTKLREVFIPWHEARKRGDAPIH